MNEELFFCMNEATVKYLTKERAQAQYDVLNNRKQNPVVFRLVPVSMADEQIITIKKVIP